MKKLLFFAAVFLLNFLYSYALYAQNDCNGSLSTFVYHPDRFTVWQKCKTVTGIIMLKRAEKDGDYHVQLKLDSGQPRLLNQKNMDKQNGALVLEVICTKKVTQADAVTPCKRCPNNITVPKNGTHVRVTGTFVLDKEGNHGWNEIHPVYRIDIL
ncbi:MAG TPA: hypothetical protein VKC90_15210 [Chitinophagaceae bacterium]|nr:hypothetical protein [Chitinophagaceae bacterium]